MNEEKLQGVELENDQPQNRVTIPQHEEIMDALNRLDMMTVGQADRLFCNSFLSEAVRLLKNSIFLYEEGYFDCAFYSVRQASETCNNMLYIANKGKPALIEWNKKQYFPLNKKVLQHLSEIDAFYSDVKVAIPGFFATYENITKQIHKTVHKQGFDTFYVLRKVLSFQGAFNKENETKLFTDFLIQTVCMVIIMYIIVDPISLVLSDEDLSMRFNFAPMAEQADVGFLDKYSSFDVVEQIKATPYFVEFSRFFREKEKMLPATFDAIRYQAFDLECLSEIESQKHLLGTDEKIILELLLAGIKFTHIHPECFMLGYYTSIRSNYQPTEWSSDDYDQYLKSPEMFNVSYHTIFRSIVKGPCDNWLIEHNDVFDDKEIEVIHSVFSKYINAINKINKYL